MTNIFDTKEPPESRSQRQRAANEILIFDEFIINSLKTRPGRKFFWTLLSRCNVYGMSWVQSSFDATAFREGQRSVGNQLLTDILRAAPESYILMMQEHQPKQKKEEAEDAT